MKVERGDLFVRTSAYFGTCIAVCVGVKEEAHYIDLGPMLSLRDLTDLNVESLRLGSKHSRIYRLKSSAILFKVPITCLSETGLKSYTHIKEKFLDTNIL